MSIFAKTEYCEIRLPFRLDMNREDIKNGIISIEAYGVIDGEKKYCYASYSLKKHFIYDNGDYERIKYSIENCRSEVRVDLIYKKERLRDFRIDINDLSKLCNDEKIKQLDLAVWGLNDKSIFM